jgi:hypothetical protein
MVLVTFAGMYRPEQKSLGCANARIKIKYREATPEIHNQHRYAVTTKANPIKKPRKAGLFGVK